ncbi:protein Frey 1 isoform X1 [Petaurus breviceps papuanus]|uniref:protein Frey 1 isoform X1 n=1 Tax=Petaurus breviceps papuanus TaxID=3040969 RepID=UPI0036D90AF9
MGNGQWKCPEAGDWIQGAARRPSSLDPEYTGGDWKDFWYQLSPMPEELDTMELPNGLVDDYGILPKHPGRRIVRSFLSRIQKHKRKRDGPDLSEYYFEAPQ